MAIPYYMEIRGVSTLAHVNKFASTAIIPAGPKKHMSKAP